MIANTIVNGVMLTCFEFDLDVNSSQFRYEVAEYIRHRDDINLTTVFTKPAFPLRLDVGEGRASRWGFLQDWGKDATTRPTNMSLQICVCMQEREREREHMN